jgi:hypothetical protein
VLLVLQCQGEPISVALDSEGALSGTPTVAPADLVGAAGLPFHCPYVCHQPVASCFVADAYARRPTDSLHVVSPVWVRFCSWVSSAAMDRKLGR